MSTDNQDDIIKPSKITQVSAQKIGVVGDNTIIEHQTISTSTVIYNLHFPKEPEEQSATISAEQDGIPDNPYKGLEYFTPNDADLFFGRDVVIDKLSASISSKRFTAVIGPSGSGKSSVVLAGVAPHLFKQGQWLFTYFRISSSSEKNPFMAMSEALIPYFNPALEDVDQLREAKKLAHCLESGELSLFDVCDKIRQNTPQKRLLLIADQFEELFTTGVAAETQQKFITLLVNTLNNQEVDDEQPVLSMVITLRADFLEQAAADAALAKLIDSNAHIIGPMEKEQLRLAIEEPAKLRGVQFEAGLVDTMLDDVGEAHGNLPLAEFALSQLWEEQHNKLIGAEAYHAIGRVKGALSLRAQKKYEELNKHNQSAAQRIFTQLVKIGSGAEDTRRIALRTDFSEEDWTLLQCFADEKHRLIVTNKVKIKVKGIDIYTAEVVHEALIRHWPLLSQWVNEKRAFLTWLDEVRRAMEQWQNYDKTTDSLLRGVALGQAQEWLSDQPENISTNVLNFVQESERQQQKKILKARRRNQILGLAACVIFLVVAILGWNQYQAKLVAENERDKQLITQSRFLADLSRQNTAKGNARVGALLAIEALPDHTNKVVLRRPYVDEAKVSLNLTLNEIMDRHWLRHDDSVTHAVFSPDGTRIVTASKDKTARVWDSVSGKRLHTLDEHTDTVLHAAFSPDGKRIVTASADNTARVWDSVNGKPMHILKGHADSVIQAEFSPDSTHIVTASKDNTARIWDSVSGNSLYTLRGHTDEVYYTAFSPNGMRIVTASKDNTAREWDSTDGTELKKHNLDTGEVLQAFFSPSGNQTLTVAKDNTTRVRSSELGDLELTLRGHTDRVSYAAFSPDGQHIITTSKDNTARVWDRASGYLLYVISGHVDEVFHAAFSPDGTRIVTASKDNSSRVWYKENRATLQSTQKEKGHTNYVYSAGFSPDGTRILTASADGTARLWDSTSGNLLRILELLHFSGNPSYAAFSPDGARIVTTADYTTPRVWDSSGNHMHRLKAQAKTFYTGLISSDAVFNPDGTQFVTTSKDKAARVWDIVSGKLLRTLRMGDRTIFQAAFSPDGASIATVSMDGIAWLWDSINGSLLHTLKGVSHQYNYATFSPDGAQFVMTYRDGVLVWNSASGKPLKSLDGYSCCHAAFSPDGARIVAASMSSTAHVWDIVSGTLLYTLEGHTSYVVHAAFSPDGKRIVTASYDKTARVWDSASGTLVHSLDGHTDVVRHAAFSPDGKRIVTASADNTARVWDSASGRLLRTLDGNVQDNTHAVFSSDGTSIVTNSEDSTAEKSKNNSTQELVDKFKQLNLPPLTAKERRDYYLD